jgi:hypothetical protein
VKKSIVRNSCVIVAKSHNPSLISTDFLQRLGIIKSFEEIDLQNLIISPFLSQVVFKNQYILNIDFERLKIEGVFGDFPYVTGNKYLQELPHIKCAAIGINFNVDLKDYDFNKWFSQFATDKSLILKSIKYQINNETNVCNLDINFIDNINCRMNLNFHYKFNEKIFKDVKESMDLKVEYEKNLSFIDDYIQKIFL